MMVRGPFSEECRELPPPEHLEDEGDSNLSSYVYKSIWLQASQHR